MVNIVCKSFPVSICSHAWHIHPSTSGSFSWDFSLSHMEKLGVHSELSWDLGMEKSEGSGGFTFMYFLHIVYMLWYAHSSSDCSLATLCCVCRLGPYASPLHVLGLISRVITKRKQNQPGPRHALRSCTVRAVEWLCPFTSNGTNHIYWAVLELKQNLSQLPDLQAWTKCFGRIWEAAKERWFADPRETLIPH